ncbi:MAG: hypothetical protein CL912_18565 [Deltaproteobacteria bacterium]|nr:hypothetical protein [Deltaproteobacteria bacterium]
MQHKTYEVPRVLQVRPPAKSRGGRFNRRKASDQAQAKGNTSSQDFQAAINAEVVLVLRCSNLL